MMHTKTYTTLLKALLMGLVLASTTVWAAKGGGGTVPSGGVNPGEDTSYAIEYSYSCLTGGCHENNAQLMDDHARSLMTHIMVKCNACHGTHTSAEVGLEKPNLTGFFPGIGATGYVVGKDRCLTCHTATLSKSGHPSNPGECISCHAPHVFPK